MDKSHERNDITRLSSRFHALMDKVQSLINELRESPPLESGVSSVVKAQADSGCSAYTICASQAHGERRQKALIKVIEDALKQIDTAVSANVETESRPESSRRGFFQYEKKLFTLEELRFLENTLRAFHPATTKDVDPDR